MSKSSSQQPKGKWIEIDSLLNKFKIKSSKKILSQFSWKILPKVQARWLENLNQRYQKNKLLSRLLKRDMLNNQCNRFNNSCSSQYTTNQFKWFNSSQWDMSFLSNNNHSDKYTNRLLNQLRDHLLETATPSPETLLLMTLTVSLLHATNKEENSQRLVRCHRESPLLDREIRVFPAMPLMNSIFNSSMPKHREIEVPTTKLQPSQDTILLKNQAIHRSNRRHQGILCHQWTSSTRRSQFAFSRWNSMAARTFNFLEFTKDKFQRKSSKSSAKSSTSAKMQSTSCWVEFTNKFNSD